MACIDLRAQTDSKQQLDEASEEGDAVLQQIAFADSIILNKVDLVQPDQLPAIETKLRCASFICP
jgi:G3E family GTPase